MPDDFSEVCARHGVDADTLVRWTGITHTSAVKYVSGAKHAPEPTRRLLLIMTHEARPEDFE